jgi:hypothetical protein
VPHVQQVVHHLALRLVAQLAQHSEAAGVGVTVVDSEDEFFEITATAKITIPNTTAIMIPFEEPVSLLLAFFEEYEEPDAGFGVVEIVDTEDLDDPLTGTAGIE